MEKKAFQSVTSTLPDRRLERVPCDETDITEESSQVESEQKVVVEVNRFESLRTPHQELREHFADMDALNA